jgi:hypothetical protein
MEGAAEEGKQRKEERKSEGKILTAIRKGRNWRNLDV